MRTNDLRNGLKLIIHTPENSGTFTYVAYIYAYNIKTDFCGFFACLFVCFCFCFDRKIFLNSIITLET